MKGRICKVYGLNHGVINLVKNELIKGNKDTLTLFNKACELFPLEDFTIIDIGDLIYHLTK